MKLLLHPHRCSQGEGSGWGHLVAKRVANVQTRSSQWEVKTFWNYFYFHSQAEKELFKSPLKKNCFLKKNNQVLDKYCSEECKKLQFLKSAAEVVIKLCDTELFLCCWCYSYFISWCNTMVINTNVTEKVIKLLTYSIIYFGTYLRATATKNWNLFISVCVLMRKVWNFLKWNFYLQGFCRPLVCHEKMQQGGTHKDKSTYRTKREWN